MRVRRGTPMRRGMGDSAQSIIQASPANPLSLVAAGSSMAGRATGSSGHGSCSWAYWNLWPGAQLDPACSNNYPAMPAPPAPTVALTPDASAPGAVYAGQDSSGNAVYAVPQTAAENMAALKDQLNTYFTNVGNANPPPPPPAAPCTAWYSFLDPTCPSSMSTGLVFVAAAVAGVLVLGVVMGGRR